jgi:hypothetical protein
VDDGNGNGEWEEEGQREGRPDGHCRAAAVIVVRERGGGCSQSDQQSCTEDQQCEAHGARRFRIMKISFVQHVESFLLESPPVPDAGSAVSGR